MKWRQGNQGSKGGQAELGTNDLVKRQAVLGALLVCCVAFLAGACSQLALAHGGGAIQLADVPAGPYLLTVWTSPPTARAGTALHLTVGVNEVSSGTPQPVLDAVISIELIPVDGTAAIMTAQATTEQSVNKLLYEADMTVMTSGSYSVLVMVAGPDGEGEASFTIVVEPKNEISWLAITLVGVGLFIAVLLIWGRRKSKPNRMQRIPRRPRAR